MAVYYNENDPAMAAWLTALIRAGVLPDGEVDTRSIVDVSGVDLAGFRHCHFFAGIGGWARALQLADWPADRAVWTGSCPCQPFSMAGKGAGAADPRHLWPAWFLLIAERRPPTVFGEQVASKDGEYWLDLVLADMEGADYAVGRVVLPAACVGAPHRRHRLWFVADDGMADTGFPERQRRTDECGPARADATERIEKAIDDQRGGATGGMADDDEGRRAQQPAARLHDRGQSGDDADGCGEPGGVEYADVARPQGRQLPGAIGGGHGADEFPSRATGAGGDFWTACDWLPCLDGVARPVEPGTFPLADGIPARVGRLRGYGNAVVPPLAALVVMAFLEAE